MVSIFGISEDEDLRPLHIRHSYFFDSLEKDGTLTSSRTLGLDTKELELDPRHQQRTAGEGGACQILHYLRAPALCSSGEPSLAGIDAAEWRGRQDGCARVSQTNAISFGLVHSACLTVLRVIMVSSI